MLFQGQGDRQFDVYREMRALTNDQWDTFCPQTNCAWLVYLGEQLMDQKQYRSTAKREQQAQVDLESYLTLLRTKAHCATEFVQLVDGLCTLE